MTEGMKRSSRFAQLWDSRRQHFDKSLFVYIPLRILAVMAGCKVKGVFFDFLAVYIICGVFFAATVCDDLIGL